jgi:hypothetical protein
MAGLNEINDRWKIFKMNVPVLVLKRNSKCILNR